MFGVQEDRRDAISHLNAIVDSTRGNPVLVSSMLLSSMHDLLKYFWDLVVVLLFYIIVPSQYTLVCLEHIFHVIYI